MSPMLLASGRANLNNRIFLCVPGCWSEKCIEIKHFPYFSKALSPKTCKITIAVYIGSWTKLFSIYACLTIIGWTGQSQESCHLAQRYMLVTSGHWETDTIKFVLCPIRVWNIKLNYQPNKIERQCQARRNKRSIFFYDCKRLFHQNFASPLNKSK